MCGLWGLSGFFCYFTREFGGGGGSSLVRDDGLFLVSGRVEGFFEEFGEFREDREVG